MAVRIRKFHDQLAMVAGSILHLMFILQHFGQNRSFAVSEHMVQNHLAGQQSSTSDIQNKAI